MSTKAWYLVYGTAFGSDAPLTASEWTAGGVGCARGSTPVPFDEHMNGTYRPWSIVVEHVLAEAGFVLLKNDGASVEGARTGADGREYKVTVLDEDAVIVEVSTDGHRYTEDPDGKAQPDTRVTPAQCVRENCYDPFAVAAVAFKLIDRILSTWASIPANAKQDAAPDKGPAADWDAVFIKPDELAEIKRMWRAGSPALRVRLYEAFPQECGEAVEEDEAFDKTSEDALNGAIREALAHGGEMNKYRTLPFEALTRFRITAALRDLPAKTRLDDYLSIFASVDPALAEQFRRDVRLALQCILLSQREVTP